MRALAPRRSRRGLTLIELMIGVAIALFLTAAAITFVRHETHLLGMSQDRVDMIQGSRAALDLIANDVRAAGQGIGYDETGEFQGLRLGAFTAGTQNFNSGGGTRPVTMRDSVNQTGGTWVSNVVDVGVRLAAGSYRTVADWDFNTNLLQFCPRDDDSDGAVEIGTGFGANDLVIIRSESGMSAETITLANITGPQPCSHGNCLFDCYSATWASAPVQVFSTGLADAPSYVGGELAGGVSDVVYFVVSDANGFGSLQRVVFNGNTCPAIDANCGGTVADGVEALQMQVYEWIPTPPAWSAIPPGPINTPNRLRVDLEMVVRAESVDLRPHDNIALRLSPGACVPMPCGTNDFTERRVYRTSVEVKNSGFGQLR